MPRPADAAALPLTNGGFGPTGSPTTQLGVYAPIDVQAAPSQASALAKALGVANDTLQPVLNRRSRLQGAADVSAGESAATLNDVNPELEAKNEGYRIGASRTVAQQHALLAMDDFEKQLSSNPDMQNLPLLDSKQGAADGLLSKADSFFRQQLGGLENDPVTAKAVMPIVQNYLNNLAAKTVQRQIATTQATAVDNAVTLAGAEAALPNAGNGGVFNYGDQLDTLKKLFGGNGVEAQTQLSQALIDKAVAAHDPKILSLIQPSPDAVALSPILQVKIAEAGQRIKGLVQSDNETWNKQAQDPIMDSILSGKDPTAQLHTYLAHPGADAEFAKSAMGFFHSQATDRANDQLDSSAAASVIADVAGGRITTSAQLLTAVGSAGVGGKAKSQLLDKGLSTLRSVQTTNVDDPSIRGGVSYLESIYKPGQDAMTGKILNPAQLNQQAGAVLDYRTEVQKLIGQGKSAEEASALTLQSINKKWGEPLEQGKSFTNRPMPATDTDMSNLIRSNRDPRALAHAGVTGAELARLQGLGMISPSDANQAAAVLITRYNK